MDQRITGLRIKEGRELLARGIPYIKMKDVLEALGFQEKFLTDGVELANEIQDLTSQNDFVSRDHQEARHLIRHDRRLVEIEILRLKSLLKLVVEPSDSLFQDFKLAESIPSNHSGFVQHVKEVMHSISKNETLLHVIQSRGFGSDQLQNISVVLARIEEGLNESDSLSQSISKTNRLVDLKLSELIKLGEKIGISSRQILNSCF
ncbi:hypothetical protein K4L44_15335 [Halosquirtibacter laminarini]|uniref:Uncharacterized protein n=1 Tax=Halosquirtibacter laminarini TaxID=3374600 RepID=A0AC61NE94_9BACT|nr:hypothetical protein K4L44_15335 [Prolixibacteraceae bacterium]